MCDYAHFKENKKFLIYAHSSWYKSKPNEYSVLDCSRTKPLDVGGIETRYLDAIVAGKDTKSIDQSLSGILTSEKEKVNVRIEAANLLGLRFNRKFDEAKTEALEKVSKLQLELGNGEVDANAIFKAILDEATHGIEVKEEVDALVKASMSSDPSLKVAIVRNLYSMSELAGRTDIKEVLLRLLKDDDQNVRNITAIALVWLSDSQWSDIYKPLVQALNEARLKQWNDKELYEKTLTTFGVSVSRTANTEKEKIETVRILYNMIDEISDPYNKSDVIRELGLKKKLATWTTPKLLEVLKSTNDYHKNTIIEALGEIEAKEALEGIKSYIKDKDCYVVVSVIEAVYKIDPDGFSEFFKNKAMPEMKARFEKCYFQFALALSGLGPAAKDMKPFLLEKYKTAKDDGSSASFLLENTIESLQ